MLPSGGYEGNGFPPAAICCRRSLSSSARPPGHPFPGWICFETWHWAEGEGLGGDGGGGGGPLRLQRSGPQPPDVPPRRGDVEREKALRAASGPPPTSSPKEETYKERNNNIPIKRERKKELKLGGTAPEQGERSQHRSTATEFPMEESGKGGCFAIVGPPVLIPRRKHLERGLALRKRPQNTLPVGGNMNRSLVFPFLPNALLCMWGG